MKKLKITLLVFGGVIFIYFGAMAFRSILVVDEQTELRTDHFIISYKGIYDEEAQDIANNLEEKYNSIRTDLDDPVHDTYVYLSIRRRLILIMKQDFQIVPQKEPVAGQTNSTLSGRTGLTAFFPTIQYKHQFTNSPIVFN